MKTLNRIYLISAILFVVIGIIVCIHWSTMGEFSPGFLIIFFPAVAFGITHVVCYDSRNYTRHAIAISLCLIVLCLWGFYAVGMESFLGAIAVVKDVGRYSEILDERWRSEEHLVEHFPRPIPSNAQEVRFSFQPAFLQGGTCIQLRCRMPADSISELYDRFSRNKTRSYFGGDTNRHMNMKEGMPTTCFYTSGSKNVEFPEDYEIMIFDKILKEEDRPAGFYWNHGRSHGVAISQKNNEIVYWAESW
jgi:hypothetical protein